VDLSQSTSLGQSDDRPRSVAEENFKAAFGHYPQRVKLPEPEPNARIDRLVHKLFTGRDDFKPDLKVVEDDA
jgi:hypothetical protein